MNFSALNLRFLIFTIFPLVNSEKFYNYSVYKVIPNGVQDIHLLKDLQNDVSYDFWNDPMIYSKFVNIMTKPESKEYLENFLNYNKMNFEITISNVQEHIDKEKISRYTRNNIRSMRWDTYYELEDIETWMEDLTATYPDILTPVVGGISYENRQIKGVKLSHGDGEKRVIFVEGGIHSREWITVTFVCYLINELLTSTDAETMAAARNFEWYIFPVLNPDGYVWTHTENRLWRKNRRPIDGTNYGVDLNRNWNNNWLEKGASTDPASNTYAGPGPFSETETRTLSKFMESISDRMDLYLSFHSSGQLLLIPFGNTTEPLANYDEAINIGRRALGALSVKYGTQYIAGNIAEAIYEATGGSIDWAKEHLKIRLVYCYELRDQGTYGHLLPADQILPNNQEVMDSVLELLHQAQRFGALLNGANGILASAFVLMLCLIVIHVNA